MTAEQPPPPSPWGIELAQKSLVSLEFAVGCHQKKKILQIVYFLG